MHGKATTHSASRNTLCMRQAGLRLSRLILLLLASGSTTIASDSEELSILVMPIERFETSGKPPFAGDKHPFERLEFDNPEADWQRLKIGNHHWLCGELNAFAQRLGASVRVRFVDWSEALSFS